MGGVIFILLGDFPVVNHKHIPINSGDMPVGPAEDLKCSIYYFIGRHDVVIVTQYVMQIDPALVSAPHQGSEIVPDIVDFFFHDPHRCPVEIVIEG